MHSPFRTGLYTRFLRYRPFSFNRLTSAIFNELFLFEKAGYVLRERRKRIFLRSFRDEEHRARDQMFRFRSVCFPQKPLDPVSHNAFAVLFPDADRHLPDFIGKIDDGEMLGMRPPAVFEDLRKFLLFFDAKVFHFRSLCGNVFSALISPSLEGVSAALRLHSLAEPVHLASLALFGLIRSLHTILLFWKLNFFIFLIIGDFVRSVKQLCGVSDG